MAFLYGLIGFLMAAPISVGLTFLIMSAILNKSNNMGDSKLKTEDFSSQIVYFSQQDNMHRNQQAFVDYVGVNMEALTRSSDYQARCRSGLKAPANALVERYNPSKNTADPQENGYIDPSTIGVSSSAMGPKAALANALSGAIPLSAVKTMTSMPLLNMHVGGAPSTANTPPRESNWAAARRQNMGEQASENPWGRNAAWGGKQETPMTQTTMDDSPVMDTGEDLKPAQSQEEIDAFWNGLRASHPSAFSSTSDTSSSIPATPATPDTSALPLENAAGSTSGSGTAGSAFGGDTGSGLPPIPNTPEEIYEAPTATRPLWENKGNDDFSDFDEFN